MSSRKIGAILSAPRVELPSSKTIQLFGRNSSQRSLSAIQLSVRELRSIRHPHTIPDNSKCDVIYRDYKYEDVMKAPAW